MPATVPSGWPKNGSNWSLILKVDPNSKSGGRSSGATPQNPKVRGGELENVGAGCSFTQDTTGHDGTSTSTTYGDCTPAKGAGYCCSNGWGCEVTGRDGQKPIEEQPPPSQTNKILQRGWMNPFEPSGPDWQSEWHPQGIKAGSGCSYEKGAASDGNGGQKPALLQLGPPPTRELGHPKKEWNPYGKEERKAWLPITKGSPAGDGRIEPMPPVPQAPGKPLTQQSPTAHDAPNHEASTDESAPKKRRVAKEHGDSPEGGVPGGEQCILEVRG